MPIKLELLPHQDTAIKKVLQAMENRIALDSLHANDNTTSNPRLKAFGGIDVKMETGTGKTYVYTRLMHELYRYYGINKFILMTPSLAIKEGVRNFIESDYSRQHFRELFAGQRIELGLINAGDFTTKRGKRKQFAGSLTDFCEASSSNIGTINALLLNDAMLGSKSMQRTDYDQTLVGGTSSPIEALRATRPIVIIDEPHRFRKDGAAWAKIGALDPQLIIRFGATFPLMRKNGTQERDYDNLVYNLDSVQSFNQGLIKAIDVQYPNLPDSQATSRYKVKKATNSELVLTKNGTDHSIKIGDELAVIDPAFDGGITYEGKRLSNELELESGMTLLPGVWTNTYQELVLRQAVDAHFEKEKALFYRPMNSPRIKVLSLFFIDNIKSYRSSDGWLKRTFEKILAEKLSIMIRNEHGEYKDFLLATQKSLHDPSQKVHAGYFSEDTGKKGDEAIQAEVDDILRNKQQLIQFKDKDGNWIVRRFLFSKWTLREGWDNPNVFVLTKLRTSGSENSKLQEVGRGLRLPVDEFGNRVSNEEFRLNFIIDYSERDFADKLIKEINLDNSLMPNNKVSTAIYGRLVQSGYGKDVEAVKKRLLLEDIIDFDQNILDRESIEALLPHGLSKDKVRNNPVHRPVVHLRTKNWKLIQDLWHETTKRYMLKYHPFHTSEIKQLVENTFQTTLFSNSSGKITRNEIHYDSEIKEVGQHETITTMEQRFGQVKYNVYLEKIHSATNLPLNLIHDATKTALDGIDNPNDQFNDITINNLIKRFNQQFVSMFYQKFEYDPLQFSATVSIFDNKGMLRETIDQNSIGTLTANDVTIPDNYLYDEARFDSEIEHQILKQVPQKHVLVFGKLPRRSIKVPTFNGGTSSPDFIYAIRDDASNSVKMHLLIEAKGKDDINLSDSEKVALHSQQKLSDLLDKVEIKLVTDATQVGEIIQEFI